MTTIKGFEAFAAELEEFAGDLEDIADEIDEAIDRGTRKTALQVERAAKKNAPVDSGELRADIGTTPLGKAEYAVGTTKKYAPSVEYGSDPHPITPNGPYPLRFQVNGEWVVTDKVEHPGTPMQAFLRPALHKHRSSLINNIRDEIESLIDSYR